MLHANHRLVHLDSRRATSVSDSGSTCTFNLPAGLIDTTCNYNSVSVNSFYAQNVFFPVNTSNNRLSILEGNLFYTYIISPGNYSLPDLLSELQKIVNDDLENIVFGYNKNTGRVYIRYQLPFTVISSSSTCQVPLGLGTDNVGSVLKTPSGAPSYFEANLPNIPDLSGTNYLCVFSPDLSLLNHSTTSGGLLQEIHVTAAPFEIIHFEPSNAKKFRLYNTQDLAQITLQVRGENGEPLDFQGTAWTISLNFSSHHENFPEKQSGLNSITQKSEK